MALQVGDQAPRFILNDQEGKTFDSTSLVGKQELVIYFYPKNFTPGCTKEACSFRDDYENFKELGAEVIGISSDSSASHGRFVERYDLPFIFLSDENGTVRKRFGIKGELLGLIPGRETFVIDKTGKVIFKYNSLKASAHITKALNALKNLNDGN